MEDIEFDLKGLGKGAIGAIVRFENMEVSVSGEAELVICDREYYIGKHGKECVKPTGMRSFPIQGIKLRDRRKIAIEIMAAYKKGLPPDWKELLSPYTAGYWDEEVFGVNRKPDKYSHTPIHDEDEYERSLKEQ